MTPGSLAPPPTPAPTIELPSGAPEAAPPEAANLSVLVGRIEVAGTFAEFQQQTSALVDPLRGRRMTVAQLYETAHALEHAYAAAGFILARVVVPPQKLTDGGSVRLVVIDGTIERVDTRAVPERLRGVVQARMAAIVGKPHVTLGEIERRLLLVSDLPGVRLRSTLARGETPGGTLLVVEAAQSVVTGSVGVDDRLPDSLGAWAVNASLALNDALGLGEQAYVSYSTSVDARLQVFGGGAILPIGADGFTLNPEYTQSVAREAPLPGAPASRGVFQRFALHAAYPVIRTRAQTLVLEATAEWEDERLTATDFGTLLYHDEYGVARWGAHDTGVAAWGAQWVLDGVYSHGFGGRNGSVFVPLSQQGASPVFDKLNTLVGLRQPLPAHLELDLTGRAQSSFDKPLMLAEQFSLDGADALSSFASGSFSVDQGASLRAELARPVTLQRGQDRPPVVFFPYLYGAYGHGELVNPTAVQRPLVDAGSAGFGLRSSAATGLGGLPVVGALSLEVGRQYSDAPAFRGGYRANFALNLSF